MYYKPLTVAEKAAQERSIDEFSYPTNLNWRFMKKLKSETQVRAWHVKVEGVDYQICQFREPRIDEQLKAYKATRSGRVEVHKPLFEKPGTDYLIGIEYLLRLLEGQDISKLRLPLEEEK